MRLDLGTSKIMFLANFPYLFCYLFTVFQFCSVSRGSRVPLSAPINTGFKKGPYCQASAGVAKRKEFDFPDPGASTSRSPTWSRPAESFHLSRPPFRPPPVRLRSTAVAVIASQPAAAWGVIQIGFLTELSQKVTSSRHVGTNKSTCWYQQVESLIDF